VSEGPPDQGDRENGTGPISLNKTFPFETIAEGTTGEKSGLLGEGGARELGENWRSGVVIM